MSVFFATSVLVLGLLTGNVQPPEWESSYGKALEATRSESRPLLVVLDKPASSEDRVAPELLAPSGDSKQAELLKSYELCHVDVTTEYGQKVAEAFKAKSFPYVAVIDKTGAAIIYSKAGKTSSDEWSRVLDAHKAGLRSTAVSRVSYKPVNGSSVMFQQPGSYIMSTSNCPNCQRRSF
jgi:hypothetical protein